MTKQNSDQCAGALGLRMPEEFLRAREVTFVPGAGFFADRADHGHRRLPYSRITETDIEPALARLRWPFGARDGFRVFGARHEGSDPPTGPTLNGWTC